MKKTISTVVFLYTLLLLCVNPVCAGRHRHKTYPLHLQRLQMLKHFSVVPYEVQRSDNELTFSYTAGESSEVQIRITDLKGKEITSVVTALTNVPFPINLPEDCPECTIRVYDKEGVYEAFY